MKTAGPLIIAALSAMSLCLVGCKFDSLQNLYTVRSLVVTANKPEPPQGYGLYVYILPGENISPAMRAALQKFLYGSYMLTTHPGEDGLTPKRIALMLLPVTTGNSPQVDLGLSGDLLRTVVQHPDRRDVYVVRTSQRLVMGTPARADATYIRLGFMEPEFVSTWLIRVKELTESDQIGSPTVWDLKLRSAFYTVGATGELVGVVQASEGKSKESREQ